jgi:hypothetical protein
VSIAGDRIRVDKKFFSIKNGSIKNICREVAEKVNAIDSICMEFHKYNYMKSPRIGAPCGATNPAGMSREKNPSFFESLRGKGLDHNRDSIKASA